MDLRDIKGPLSLTYHIDLLAIGLIVLAAVVALLFFFLKRKKSVAPVASPRPAHEIALEQLRGLRQKDLVGQGKTKEYYSEISDIIRRYLENRFMLKAPEMTTDEFLWYVRDYGKLAEEHKVLLKEFLNSCDLVKFARYKPSAGEMEAIYWAADKFVNQTKEFTDTR